MSTAEQGIRAAVGRAWWRFHAARVAECTCLGLAAGLVTLAAAVLSGAVALSPDGLAAAALSALACGAAWWRERRRTPAEVAHRLDAGLGRGGALVTAFECAGRSERGELEELLLEREAGGLEPSVGRRAIAPPSAAFVAAPLVAAALLSLTFEHSRGAPAGVRKQVAGTLAGAGRVEPGSEAGAATGGRDLETSNPDQGLAPEPSGGTPAEGLAGEPAPVGAAEPEGAAGKGTAPERPVDTAGTGGTGEPGETGAGGSRAGDLTDSSGSALADGGGGSTMAGSAPGVGADMTRTRDTSTESSPSPGAGSAAPEPGVVAGRWWPAQYDAIVRDWTAARGQEQQP